MYWVKRLRLQRWVGTPKYIIVLPVSLSFLLSPSLPLSGLLGQGFARSQASLNLYAVFLPQCPQHWKDGDVFVPSPPYFQ